MAWFRIRRGVKKVADLALALENWLEKKRQYEQHTDANEEVCRVSEDSLIAAMFRLMPQSMADQMMLQLEDCTCFADLYDKLVAYTGVKSSLRIKDRLPNMPTQGGGVSPMEIVAVDGKGGKHRQTKGGKKDRPDVTCWHCGVYAHYGRDWRKNPDGNKSGGRGSGK